MSIARIVRTVLWRKVVTNQKQRTEKTDMDTDSMITGQDSMVL